MIRIKSLFSSSLSHSVADCLEWSDMEISPLVDGGMSKSLTLSLENAFSNLRAPHNHSHLNLSTRSGYTSNSRIIRLNEVGVVKNLRSLYARMETFGSSSWSPFIESFESSDLFSHLASTFYSYIRNSLSHGTQILREDGNNARLYDCTSETRLSCLLAYNQDSLGFYHFIMDILPQALLFIEYCRKRSTRPNLIIVADKIAPHVREILDFLDADHVILNDNIVRFTDIHISRPSYPTLLSSHALKKVHDCLAQCLLLQPSTKASRRLVLYTQIEEFTVPAKDKLLIQTLFRRYFHL